MGVHGLRLQRGRRDGARDPTCGSGCGPTCGSGFEGPRATARHRMKEGEQLFCALSWSEHPPPQDFDEAYARLVWTAHHWQHWLDRGTFPDHPWRTYLQRSALTLKGLTYAPTGALLAAATTSLPETPQGERNWDYRYSWIRDSTFMLWALYTLGFDWEANDFFYFIADVAGREDELQVMYGLGGERNLDEHDARPPRRLRGRPAGPDRQRRLHAGAARRLGRAARLGLPAHALARPLRRARLADPRAAGRDGDRPTGASPIAGSGRFAASPSTSPPRRCSAGSPATAARAWRSCARTGSGPSAGRRRPTRSTPTSARTRVDERGVFVQHYDTTALDAALLLMPLLRFLPPDDPRIRNTVLAIADELTENGLVLRYRTDETDDGLTGREGTFTDLLVLAGVGARGDRRAQARPRAVRAAARLRLTARALRRGDRPAAPAGTSGTSRRRSRTWR